MDASPATIKDFELVFKSVVGYLLGFASVALFILLIIGGFKFITSGGDPKMAEGAKKTITSAITGLIVILLAYVILIIIGNITGAELTKFSISLP